MFCHFEMTWIVAFLSTVIINPVGGLILSLIFQLFAVVARTQWFVVCATLQTNTSLNRATWRAHFSKEKNRLDVCAFRFEAALLFSNGSRFTQAASRSIKKWNESGLGEVSGQRRI